MKELELKYGCNPNQKPSKIYVADGSELPIKVLSGKPGYINFLDAFNGWQLVRDLKKPDFRQQHLLNMFLLRELPSDFLLQRPLQKFTG